MLRRLPARLLVPALALALGGTTATVANASTGHRGHHDLAKVKHATAKYHKLSRAQAAGYSLLLDANGIACIDMPGMGAMGIHYVNGSLVGDGTIDARRPEAVVYQPTGAGRLRLVAVEYVVLQDAWDAGHSSPPSLFGKRFDFTPAGNRYGLPPFYSLHAWVWKRNPAGTFAMWNPRVTCAPRHRHEDHRGTRPHG